MANTNITRKTNTTANTTAKVEEILNNTLNINRTAKTPKVDVIKSCGTTFLTLEDEKVGVIGSSEKEQKANIACVQFMVDNAERCENGRELGIQCDMLTRVMAELEGVNLDDVITIYGHEYVVTNNKAYNEMGRIMVDIDETYPELKDVEMPYAAQRAVVIAELQKLTGKEEEAEDEAEEINIDAEQKLSIIDTIKGLKALGMSASWFNVNGTRQPMPICYNGEADLKQFTNVIKKAVDNEYDYLDVILSSCRYKENDINADEVCDILGVAVLLDYTKKEAWTEDGGIKVADISDIETELPKEAVKVMLIERAKTRIEEAANERNDDYDEDCYEEDDCDLDNFIYGLNW